MHGTTRKIIEENTSLNFFKALSETSSLYHLGSGRNLTSATVCFSC